MPLATSDLDYVRSVIYSASGIVLENKEYLIETRLATLAQANGFNSLANLIQGLREANGRGPLQTKIIDAMTTNETLFFRDTHPFEALRDSIIPEVMDSNLERRRLRVWSAACSTGQEPYTIAMILLGLGPVIENWRIDIDATDIAESVLAQAREGIFNQLSINRGLSAEMLKKFFKPCGDGWRVSSVVRRMVSFQLLNLVKEWPKRDPYDIVLLRNVMIYFDAQSRRDILNRMANQITPGGYLLMGSGETPTGLTDQFDSVLIGKSIFYRRKL